MFVLALAQLAAAGCASVPTPATKAPSNPASAAAAEGRMPALEVFDPVEPGRAPSPTSPGTPAVDHSAMGHAAPAKPVATSPSSETYTCVMHPHVSETKPGKCPICGMALEKKPKEKK